MPEENLNSSIIQLSNVLIRVFKNLCGDNYKPRALSELLFLL